jgi:hypothetical protein
MKSGYSKDSPNKSANIAILISYPFFGNAFSSVLPTLPEAEFVTDFSNKPPGMEYPEEAKQRLREWLTDSSLPWRDFEMSKLTQGEFFAKYTTVVASHDVGIVRHPALERHRKVRVFYGGAKDLWAFSLGNVLFDKICTPGPFYTDTLHTLYGNAGVTALSTGEPKLDALHKLTGDTARKTLGITASRPVVLYVPTWGALSSITSVVGMLPKLSSSYELIVKAHHMTAVYDSKTLEPLKDLPLRVVDDRTPLSLLLAAADVVVSDGSGAALDAVSAKKPLVVLDTVGESNQDFFIETAFYGEREGVLAGTSTSAQSPEQRIKYGETKLAPVVDLTRGEGAGRLERAIEEALAQPNRYAVAREKFLAAHTTPIDGKAGERVAAEISSLATLSIRDIADSKEPFLRILVRDFEKRMKERESLVQEELSKLREYVGSIRALRTLPFRKRLAEVERLFFS